MLSVKETARWLNVSPSTVYGLINSGELKCHRVGVGRGVIRISEAAISDYLDSCTAGTRRPAPPRTWMDTSEAPQAVEATRLACWSRYWGLWARC